MSTSGRSVPEEFSRDKLTEIERGLTAIERDHRVAIGLAIESGSRAWGFPSPDSDYDCRFLFVRPAEEYLSPWQRRDVIETPLVNDLDISGWDLGKALKLLLKGNAVAIEWLMSPIVYHADEALRTDLTKFAGRYSNRWSIGRHYLHLGQRQRRTYFTDVRQVPLKKLFYALRPAAALRWLRLHPESRLPPMHLPTLLNQCDPPQEIAALTADLIERKRVTRELGTAPLPAAIGAFIDSEFEAADGNFPRAPHRPDTDAIREAEELFRRTIGRLQMPSLDFYR